MPQKEALLYNKKEDSSVECCLCHHRCRINEGKYGFCHVRQNIGGILYSQVYGELITYHADPIEKKPLFHFLPGSRAFSIATTGCNFRCNFCQNWQISQVKEARRLEMKPVDMTPGEIVSQAEKYRCQSISYTYTEPTIFFELAYDTARIAKQKGIYNTFVTNGYMTGKALEMIQPYLDAANVDLKFFNDDNYRRICRGSLPPVLETIRLMHKLKIWVEVTTLVIPSLNDSPGELRQIAAFIAGVGKEIPWHISRFHPDYQTVDLPSTPREKLEQAYNIGREAGLRYVYIGNIAGEENTYCYQCGRQLISRIGFQIAGNDIKESKCPDCGAVIDGVRLST